VAVGRSRGASAAPTILPQSVRARHPPAGTRGVSEARPTRAAAALAERGSQPARGIAAMVAGVALLTLQDAVIKALTAAYPIGEILFVRGLFVFVPVALFARCAGGLASLRVRDWGGQAARAALTVVSTFLFVTGLALLPLADAVAVVMAGPLFITALAPALLGERVGWRRWSAVIVGLTGVLIMIRPTGEAVRLAALLPLAAAFTGALRDLLTRRLSLTEGSTAILLVTTAAVTLSGLATWPFSDWAPMGWRDVALLALSGCLLGAAHFLLIEAFRLAEAGLVAPFKFTNMLWAVLFGFIIWGELPDRWVLAGALLVVASGLYILRREAVRRA